MTDDRARQAERARERAAKRYRPDKIQWLLVAEAPPSALHRYFYFENVWEQDALFRYVYRGVAGKEPSRGRKAQQLNELKKLGVFLIDVKPDPSDGSDLASYVPSLVKRCKFLRPAKIILIKATVFDVAYDALVEAGLPVVEERIPFPGSGWQREFEVTFARALRRP